MKNTSGVVVSFAENIDVPKNGGGSYKGWRLIYTNSNTNEVVTLQKHINSLKFAKELQNSLRSLKSGDQIVISEEKNDAGFWDVKDIKLGTDTSVGMSIPQPAQQVVQQAKSFQKSDDVQKYIIRQSSLQRAIEYATLMGFQPSEVGLMKTAAKFADWVLTGDTGDIADLEDDIPE